jgi:hypothetical protein
MAPKRATNPGKTARYYAKSPAARANKKYRAELNAARRKDDNYGKGGADYSHTRSGRLVRESAKKNRARNGSGGKSTKK